MDWTKCLKEYKRIFRVHALRRMFERNIKFAEVDEILDRVEVIEEYPEDRPFTSCLILGFTRSNKPSHMVFSVNNEEKTVIIITVYVPDKNKWEANFRRRVI